jgi:hypothetical protein
MSESLPQQIARIDAENAAKRAVLVYNERTKLMGNAVDRASTALITVGVLGPVASYLYGIGPAVGTSRHVAWFTIWTVCAVFVHSFAGLILGRLKHV